MAHPFLCDICFADAVFTYIVFGSLSLKLFMSRNPINLFCLSFIRIWGLFLYKLQ